MAKFRSSNKKKNGILKLNIFIKKLQKSLLLGRTSNAFFNDNEKVSDSNSTYVPEDVKEGQFTVITMDSEKPTRFVLSLSYLTHPMFLMLLEQAAEEYGFNHEGALTIPCRPSVIERILTEQWKKKGEPIVGVAWDSCNAMVQSCASNQATSKPLKNKKLERPRDCFYDI